MKDAAFFHQILAAYMTCYMSCGETGQRFLLILRSFLCPWLWQQEFSFRQCHCRDAKCRGVQSCQEHLSHWSWKVLAGTSECTVALGLVWMKQERYHNGNKENNTVSRFQMMEKLREEKEWGEWNNCSEMPAQVQDWNSSLTCCLYLTSEKSYIGGSIARLFSTMSTIFWRFNH